MAVQIFFFFFSEKSYSILFLYCNSRRLHKHRVWQHLKFDLHCTINYQLSHRIGPSSQLTSWFVQLYWQLSTFFPVFSTACINFSNSRRITKGHDILNLSLSFKKRVEHSYILRKWYNDCLQHIQKLVAWKTFGKQRPYYLNAPLENSIQ